MFPALFKSGLIASGLWFLVASVGFISAILLLRIVKFSELRKLWTIMVKSKTFDIVTIDGESELIPL